jgi:hypothetical protein
MNNETVTPDFNIRQDVTHTESSISSIPLSRGIEIVPSAALSKPILPRSRACPLLVIKDDRRWRLG